MPGKLQLPRFGVCLAFGPPKGWKYRVPLVGFEPARFPTPVIRYMTTWSERGCTGDLVRLKAASDLSGTGMLATGISVLRLSNANRGSSP